MKKLLLLNLLGLLTALNTSVLAGGYTYDYCPSIDEVKFLPNPANPERGYYEAQNNREWKSIAEFPAGVIEQFSHAAAMSIQRTTTVSGMSCFYNLKGNTLIYLRPFPNPDSELNVAQGVGSWQLQVVWGSQAVYLCNTSQIQSCPFTVS